ncbi:MAG: pyridoxamine kinase [Desulfobulbus sp.]|jgi:pyridoxine kinase
MKPVKQVAAIHDLSGYGRGSLTVVIPILSTMGCNVCPLPTSILSANSHFPGFHFVDLTDEMGHIIEHWKTLALDFNAIYSGWLGSPRQIDIVADFIESFRRPGQLVMIDPVLGDAGRLYAPFGPEMQDKMKELIRHASIITPNLTEAAMLLDRGYSEEMELAEVKDWIMELADQGPETVIFTSAALKGQSGKTSVIAYSRLDHRMWKVSCEYLPAEYPGTGDTFSSIITGCLLQGDSLPIALDRAVQFISLGIRSTFGYDYDSRQGIVLERILQALHYPVQIGSYEIL